MRTLSAGLIFALAATTFSSETLGARGASFGAARANREGNLLYKGGRYDSAIEKYARAQLTDPELPELKYNLGNVLYRQGKFAEAVDEYNQIAPGASSGVSVDAVYNQGNALFKMEKYRQAADSYRKALLDRPGDRETKRNLELSLRMLKTRQQQQKQQQQQGQGQKPKDSQQQQKQPEQEGREEESRSSDRKEGDSRDSRERSGKGEPRGGGESKGDSLPQKAEQKDAESEEYRRKGAKFTEKQAEKLLQALAGDEARVLQRLMRPRGRNAGSREDW